MTVKKIISHHINNPVVTVPGSKYLANRYVAIAALANGATVLRNMPVNDDIEAALEAVQRLGAKVTQLSEHEVSITGIERFEQPESIHIDCRDSGTLSRFVTALASNLSSTAIIGASAQMRQRPMEEVTASLRSLGVSVQGDKLPIELKGPLQGGQITLDTSRSSQYLSGLLIACLKAKTDTRIRLEGKTVSSSYIQLTKDAIARFGGQIEALSDKELLIPANQDIVATDIQVAGDVVSSSYFMAAALLAKTSVTLQGYAFNSPQGESGFYRVLEAMGAEIETRGNDLRIAYEQPLQGVDVDMGDMPDAVPTLVVTALFASGQTHITNIAHLAFKESNRIVDLCEQLKKLGAVVEYDDDSITVTGQQPLTVARLSSCHDHRLAMSFALIGLRLPGVVIEDAQAVEKSFPLYWQYLEQIGVEVVDID
ncbi:3-phosphoshikimate 1-carboxyvinyltransferase [Kangiella shandongensis]|uniref:3-phosphoshikimate 1-carboxyvinyltransferase n=1 Tax=Kangiella shandongensis TaxID=2763258 RepID=UPI001CBD622F|nr:3-phosphoshikimate 1-carboxyvinyltransferase [Kangiella shandongensis]